MNWLRCACLLPVLAGCAAPAEPDSARDRIVVVPVTDAAGQTQRMQGRLCRPAGDAPARLVVINHGSPANAADRPRQAVGTCGQEAARWFLDRGFVVLFPLRRGYGDTGGQWAETYGRCDEADYVAAGLETARDIDAAVRFGTALPFVQPAHAVVVGVSAGGWGTVAYDSQPHPLVSAMVSMAGGRGGHQDGLPGRNCHPEKLAQAAGQFGKTATTPMLWVYAANDSFFAPPIAEALHESFTAAGGRTTFQQTGPYGTDGHRLFPGNGGSAIWGPMVAAYLAGQPG